MGRPKGLKNKRPVLKPELGVVGVYVPDFTTLMEKIAEAIHEDAKVSGIFMRENKTTYELKTEDSDGDEKFLTSETVPLLYPSIVEVLEETIKRVKGKV